MKLKGFSEKVIMTLFWIIFALGAVAVFFLLGTYIFDKLVGVTIS